jgi:hypothetical protein
VRVSLFITLTIISPVIPAEIMKFVTCGANGNFVHYLHCTPEPLNLQMTLGGLILMKNLII